MNFSTRSSPGSGPAAPLYCVLCGFTFVIVTYSTAIFVFDDIDRPRNVHAVAKPLPICFNRAKTTANYHQHDMEEEAAFQRTKGKRPPIITRIYNSEKEDDNDLALLDQIVLGTGRQRPFPFFIILFCDDDDDDDDDFLTTICRQNTRWRTDQCEIERGICEFF